MSLAGMVHHNNKSRNDIASLSSRSGSGRKNSINERPSGGNNS